MSGTINDHFKVRYSKNVGECSVKFMKGELNKM